VRVVVVGAGIAGISVARALVARGCRPTVVAPDHGFTPSGAGIVSEQFADPLLAARARRSAEVLRRSVTAHACPMAQIALSGRSAGSLGGIEGSRPGLPAALRRDLAPDFLGRIARAVWSPRTFWVAPREVLRAFARGSRIVRARVRAVREGLVETDRGAIPADAVVVANGVWARRLLPDLRFELRRAQTARARGAISAMFHVLDTGLYARPDGRFLLAGDGDARWSAGPGPRASAVTRGFLVETAGALRRTLRACGPPRPGRAGLVAMTADRRPIVGRRGGVWVACAFGGDGLALAPAFGEEVAGEILGISARATSLQPRVDLQRVQAATDGLR
jgi:glycine/D-amino acid oxidase-like deaminating enzyme